MGCHQSALHHSGKQAEASRGLLLLKGRPYLVKRV